MAEKLDRDGRLALFAASRYVRRGASRKTSSRASGSAQTSHAEPTSESKGEAMFFFQCKATKLPLPDREFKFKDDRRWRFDFAWPACRVAVEIEGGVWTEGRHTRGGGYIADMEKYNAAGALGWLVLRFDSAQVKSGVAIKEVESILKGRINE